MQWRDLYEHVRNVLILVHSSASGTNDLLPAGNRYVNLYIHASMSLSVCLYGRHVGTSVCMSACVGAFIKE